MGPARHGHCRASGLCISVVHAGGHAHDCVFILRPARGTHGRCEQRGLLNMTQNVQKNAAVTRGRRKILLIALAAALPMAIAYTLFYSGWRPGSTANYCELVQPARPIADAALQTLDKKKIRFSEW